MANEFNIRNGFISKSGSTVQSYLNVSGNTTSPAFITVDGLDNQFVKGDGTLDSTLYEPIISPKNTAFNKNFGIASDEVAAGTHKYHKFSDEEYYYDLYSQPYYLRLFTENATFDTIRFQPYSNVEYHNGTSWVTWAQSLDTLLDGREETGFSLQRANKSFRFEITRNTGWPTECQIVLQSTWSNITGASADVTIETWSGTVWEVKSTSSFSGNPGIWLKSESGLHDGRTLLRVTVECDWTAVTCLLYTSDAADE